MSEGYQSIECTVRLNWSPPRADLVSVWSPMEDPGGWVYSIYRPDGQKHIGGVTRGPDKDNAIRYIVARALQAGYNTIKFETRECPI